MNKEFFVQNIKLLCLRKGIKPTIACKESGVGGSFINDIERGRVPSVAKVQMLAEYLGCTTSELLGEPAAKDNKGPTPVSESEPEDPLAARLMELVRQLSPDSKKMLIAQLEMLLRSQSP